MSKDIPTIGKVWLILMLVLAAFGFVANLLSVGSGIIYLISALACAGEAVGLFFILKGKGINFYYIYCGCYLVNGVLSYMANDDKSTAYLVGFVLGIAINLGLTYLAAKNTFKKA